MCLSKPVEVTDNRNKTLAYNVIFPFTVHQHFVMFYNEGPIKIKIIKRHITEMKKSVQQQFNNPTVKTKL
jgi:hypothetical protein